ncbi:hypothetical protein [Pseudomonas sp.]|uniref:hypothetical protein n=1 Tax=Pseudomonas sp. TaxID=306 RepID=UPI0026123296|nr:hypothetical protein [Pseudomonas sp.]
MSCPLNQGQTGAGAAFRRHASASARLNAWLSKRAAGCAQLLDVDGPLPDIPQSPDAVSVPDQLRAALAQAARELAP